MRDRSRLAAGSLCYDPAKRPFLIVLTISDGAGPLKNR